MDSPSQTAEPALRPATSADLPEILEIYNDVVQHTTAIYDEQPGTLAQRAAWFEGRVSQGLPVLVAVSGGAVAGVGSYGPFRPWPGYRFTVEHSVHVARPYRRRGIGRRLVAALVEAARAQGMHAVIAGIDAENTASLRLHAALGFAQVAHFRQVGFKFGRWLDLVCFELLLEPGAESETIVRSLA